MKEFFHTIAGCWVQSPVNLSHNRPKHQSPFSNTKTLFLFIEIVLSKWSQNPYARGSWSDPVIGTDHTVHANMAGRVKNLFFGGEATHGDWYGFMQGAYFSGQERANEIASCIQRKKCEAYQPSTGIPVIVKPCVINASFQKRLSLSLLAVALIFLGSL